MLGPFDQKPIPLHISPFMTREKPDSEVRRTIVDLSWPKKFSVNDGVTKDKYLGSSFVLNYPSLDDIVNSNSTFIALNLYLMIDSKTQKAKIRDRNR